MTARSCVWITGGGSGIGAALARRLARDGEQVVISGVEADDLGEVAAGQPGIIPFPLDTADSSAVRNGVQRIERDIAPITLAILTAGAGPPAPLSAFERERLRSRADSGVGGALNCLAALVPVLRQRGRGHVVIVSPAGKSGGTTLAPLARTLARDLIGSGVRIQVIDAKTIEAAAEAQSTARAVEAILRGLRSVKGPAGEGAGLWAFLRGLLPGW